MTPREVGTLALEAILDGAFMTLHLPAHTRMPKGWPRGKLLSVTESGRNYRFNPLAVLRAIKRDRAAYDAKTQKTYHVTPQT